MHKYTDAHIHKYTNTNSPLKSEQRYTDPQIHRWTNKDTQMQKCTETETLKNPLPGSPTHSLLEVSGSRYMARKSVSDQLMLVIQQ